MFLEYWFPQCWTFYYKDVSSLADDLKRVECSAKFVSLVLLDQDFITQFDAGGTGHALYAACKDFTFSFPFSIAIMYFKVVSMVNV